MVRGQLSGLRGGQEAPPGDRLHHPAPDQVQEVLALTLRRCAVARMERSEIRDGPRRPFRKAGPAFRFAPCGLRERWSKWRHLVLAIRIIRLCSSKISA